MKKILLKSAKYGNRYLIIDDEDYDLVKKYNWSLASTRGLFYATHSYWTNGSYKGIKAHRLIMCVLNSPKIFIDHRDRNGLNNQKSNLRITTFSQNACNTSFLNKSNTGYRGVYQYKSGKMKGKITACIKINNKRIFGGYFDSAIEAAKRYNELAIIHHKEFARLNPIPS